MFSSRRAVYDLSAPNTETARVFLLTHEAAVTDSRVCVTLREYMESNLRNQFVILIIFELHLSFIYSFVKL